jgi:sugar lactone lactonase YvrE
MAIESAASIRRLVRTGFQFLFATLFLSAVAVAQVPVTSGSVIPFNHAEWGQVYRVVVTPNGNVIFLDTTNGAVYQLPPGSSTVVTLSGPGVALFGGFDVEGMAVDSNNVLYFTDRYYGTNLFRVPYNPADGTWDLTANSVWTQGKTAEGGFGTIDVEVGDFVGGMAPVVVSSQSTTAIYEFMMDASGNIANPSAPPVISKLTDYVNKMAIDHAGNIFFLEGPFDPIGNRANGLFMIPAGSSNLVGEGAAVRIDPPADGYAFKGVTVDAAGNLYLTSEVDSYGGNFSGVIMIPNSSGSPTTANVNSFDFNNAILVSPVSSPAPLAVDPRGFLWIPTGTGGWTPNGETLLPGTQNVVQWEPGAATAGATPVGTPSGIGQVFYNFNLASTSPAAITFSQAGGASNFAASATNPFQTSPPSTQLPCTANPATPYLSFSTCPFWFTATPTLPGADSAELQLKDSTGNVIAGSTVFVSAVGQAPAASILVPSAANLLSTALKTPSQVAADTAGNSYVADPGQGKVLMFSAAAGAGVAIGTFKSPTGVAVDGCGNVYVGDSGSVYEIPYQSGALNSAAQTVIQTGLGSTLNLAVDEAGNVFAADASNAQVVRISNPETEAYLSGTPIITAGAEFTGPSAVATDSTGDIFVADGDNLYELTQLGGAVQSAETLITSQLSGPVTGLAVDPSGSVIVAQSSGLLRIPAENGSLTFNDAIGVASGVVTTPIGAALDAKGNIYTTSSAPGTPTLVQIPINGSIDFGDQSPATPSNPEDAQLFNIGNLPLALTGNPSFTGPNGGDYSYVTAGNNPCDPMGATTVAPGLFCNVGVVLTASNTGPSSATLNVPTNAANAATVTAALAAVVVGNLCDSATTLTLTPPSGFTFPGAFSAAVSVTPGAGCTGSPTGNVAFTVTTSTGGTSTQIMPISASGAATFTVSGLNGGTYSLNAQYDGDSNFKRSSQTQSITVNPATPAISVSPVATYILVGGTYAITATVTSSLGAPTGSVEFLLNGKIVATSTLNGSGEASFNTAGGSGSNAIQTGTYTLTAVYLGDTNFATVTSAPQTLQIINPSVLITTTTPTISTPAGTPVSATLTLTSLVGFNASVKAGTGVDVICVASTLPPNAACTFDNPLTSVYAGQAPTNLVLTISTNTAPAESAALRRLEPSTIAFAGTFGLGLIGLVFTRKRNSRRSIKLLSFLLVLAGAGLGASGCGNGYTHTPPAPTFKTTAGTYNVGIQVVNQFNLSEVESLPFTLTVTVK